MSDNQHINKQEFKSRKPIPQNGDSERGRIVQRYNVALAQVEYYFIPSDNLEAYELARSRQDLSANKKYGLPMKGGVHFKLPKQKVRLG